MDAVPNMREMVGSVIAERYRLENYLAEGNFGAVYQATQIAYGVPLREVAIKISKRPMDDLQARKTFGDALMMARVVDSAPDLNMRLHFVQVFDAGHCPKDGALPGHPYLVMEYVQGGSLKDSLKSGEFPLTRAIEYFTQVLEAVSFMHGGLESPIAHRDLKPDNILVKRAHGGKDRVMVTDFGLAVEVDTLLGWVKSGGDLAYLAPEAFSHDISSPQSDVYMLGLVFYEMLTGHNPFSHIGEHLRGEDEQKREELRRLHLAARQMERFSGLEENLELRKQPAMIRVIRTALEPDMTCRTYNNAFEMNAAWLRALKNIDVVTKQENEWEHARRLCSEAEQCYAVADTTRGDAFLDEAEQINNDRSKVPDSKAVGQVYILNVRRMLRQGKTKEAGAVANEGYRRRKCRSTIQALIDYYKAVQSPLVTGFMQEQQRCQDQE